MSICLVTGASGFIGGHLVDALVSRGDEVRCLVRSTSDVTRLGELGVDLCVADLAGSSDLASAVAGADMVYHVAGVMHTPRPAEQTSVNRDSVSRLLEACAQQKDSPRFVLVSSVAAAGPAEPNELRRESDQPAPVSNYGRSKLAGELAARTWADRIPITVVRPGIVFGPRDRNMLPLFRTIARLRIHVVPTLRPPRLSLIYVTDLVQLLMRSAAAGSCLPCSGDDANADRGIYFACAPEYPTYSELGTLIATAIGRKRIVCLPMPGLIPWIVAASNEGIGRLRGRSSALRVDKIREAKAPCWACSCVAAERDLGFQTTRPLAERFRETAIWYREQGLL